MRNQHVRFIAAGALLVLSAGCGASTPPRQGSARVEPASSKSGYDFRKEGQIPPSTGGSARPETDVEEIALEDSSSLQVSEADAPPDTTPKVSAPADSTGDGFRIQLFASADRDVAQNARDVAAQRLGVPAYLDLDGGVYKVRVGDYRRREDAAAALPSVRAQYYPDAWIVSARINVPRTR